jgi:hypothetical protein
MGGQPMRRIIVDIDEAYDEVITITVQGQELSREIVESGESYSQSNQ